ncbi:hypothetical protein K1719_041448 [Acacia pycnantha]|nr:hypothetical protein K1719_041448 [Acacia pycnantha]
MKNHQPVEVRVDDSDGAKKEESSAAATALSPINTVSADWNSYAASQPTEENFDSAFGFDIESTVRSANDTVTGTFSVTQFPTVSIIPQPADTGKVDLVMNVVERPSGGFSVGGGISSGITSGPLFGLIGSFAYSGIEFSRPVRPKWSGTAGLI